MVGRTADEARTDPTAGWQKECQIREWAAFAVEEGGRGWEVSQRFRVGTMKTNRSRNTAMARSATAAPRGIQKAITRVLIVDNHGLVRRGLAALVRAEPDMVVVGEAPCTPAALDAVVAGRPDVVVVGMSAGQGTGLALIQGVRQLRCGIRIVALAMHDRPERMERSLEAGAAVFVQDGGLGERVLEAIRRTSATPLRSDGADGQAGGAAAGAGQSQRSLDALERAIAAMIGRGLTTRGIAMELGLSVATVEAHRRDISAKLNLRTAPQFVQFCVQLLEREAGRNSGPGRPVRG